MELLNDKYKRGQWDMFEFITSVYFGKQYYALERHGLVYSRHSHEYMSFDEAISEFCSFIGD